MLDRRREQRWPAYLGGKISFSKRWRRFDVLGVEVAHPPAAEAPVPLNYVRRIKQLEADNKRLKNCLQGP
jgi:hypothetical protein